MFVPVGVVRGGLRLTDDDKAPVGRVEHLDRRVEQTRQRVRGDDLGRRATRSAAPAQVHDVGVGDQDRDYVVGHHQDRYALVVAAVVGLGGVPRLVGTLEAVKVLVAQLLRL